VGEKRFRAKTVCANVAQACQARDKGAYAGTSSLIRTMTVGSGLGPDLLTPAAIADCRTLAGSLLSQPTAGGDLHPALKTYCMPPNQDGMESIVRLGSGHWRQIPARGRGGSLYISV